MISKYSKAFAFFSIGIIIIGTSGLWFFFGESPEPQKVYLIKHYGFRITNAKVTDEDIMYGSLRLMTANKVPSKVTIANIENGTGSKYVAKNRVFATFKISKGVIYESTNSRYEDPAWGLDTIQSTTEREQGIKSNNIVKLGDIPTGPGTENQGFPVSHSYGCVQYPQDSDGRTKDVIWCNENQEEIGEYVEVGDELLLRKEQYTVTIEERDPSILEILLFYSELVAIGLCIFFGVRIIKSLQKSCE